MFSDGVEINVVVKESAHLNIAEKYGYVVAKFCLSGDSYAQIASRANKIRSQNTVLNIFCTCTITVLS